METLGIDLGTSSVKVTVLDDEGRMLARSRSPYGVTTPMPGWAETDPHDWWDATLEAVHSVRELAPGADIGAVGLSGQMHGVVLADDRMSPVRRGVLWPDRRAADETQVYRGLPNESLARLANPILPGMAGPILCWLARHETETYRLARWALQPKDWLRSQLTREAAAEPSDASATLLYDVVEDRWADDVISGLGLERELFAPLVASVDVAGHLSGFAAEALGLRPGLPIAAGAADTAAAALGTGLLVPGVTQMAVGTGAQVIQIHGVPPGVRPAGTHLYRTADRSSWYVMAAVQNAGLALEWVCRTFRASWDELYASAAELPPGAGGPAFLPLLTGERQPHPSPGTAGVFAGLRLEHQRQHLLRAALEGVAFGIRAAVETLAPHDCSSVLRLSGGGSIHPAWRQMLADVLGRDLAALDDSAASARGAALLAAIVVGTWSDCQETRQVAPRPQVVATPDPQRARMYDELYARHSRLLASHLVVLGT